MAIEIDLDYDKVPYSYYEAQWDKLFTPVPQPEVELVLFSRLRHVGTNLTMETKRMNVTSPKAIVNYADVVDPCKRYFFTIDFVFASIDRVERTPTADTWFRALTLFASTEAARFKPFRQLLYMSGKVGTEILWRDLRGLMDNWKNIVDYLGIGTRPLTMRDLTKAADMMRTKYPAAYRSYQYLSTYVRDSEQSDSGEGLEGAFI